MPPKHSFTVPRGPCMNPVCPHLVCCDITCVCTEGGPEAHSLFAPLCETLRWNDPNLRRNTAEAKFPGKAAIEYGRSHSQRKDREEHMGGHRKQEEIRWKRLSDGEWLALGCACLPPNAVACNDCAKEARRLVVDEVGRSAHHKKIVLKNAGRMVDSLPDEAVSSLASYTTQQVWLGEAEEGAGAGTFSACCFLRASLFLRSPARSARSSFGGIFGLLVFKVPRCCTTKKKISL